MAELSDEELLEYDITKIVFPKTQIKEEILAIMDTLNKLQKEDNVKEQDIKLLKELQDGLLKQLWEQVELYFKQ